MDKKLLLKDIKRLQPIKIPNAQMQALLTYHNRSGYHAGVYGWNGDVYIINDVAIYTGYRVSGSSPKLSYKELKEYEDRAYYINCNNELNYNDKVDQVNALLYEVIGRL